MSNHTNRGAARAATVLLLMIALGMSAGAGYAADKKAGDQKPNIVVIWVTTQAAATSAHTRTA